MTMKMKRLIETVAVLLTVVSCRTQAPCGPACGDAERISLECSMEYGTKGSYAYEVTDFRLFRYSYEGSHVNCDIFDEPCRQSGRYWMTENAYRKTVNASNRYVGIGPGGSVGEGNEITVKETLTRMGTLCADICVPEDASDQSDLIFGFSEPYESPLETFVPDIRFRHILANVRISAYTSSPQPGIHITGAGFIDVYDCCTLLFENRTETLSYGSRVQSQPSVGKALDTDLSGCILPPDEGGELFLIPQTVPDGGHLYLDYISERGSPGRVCLDVSGDLWPAGVVTTYSMHLVSVINEDGSAGLIIGDFKKHHDYEEVF